MTTAREICEAAAHLAHASALDEVDGREHAKGMVDVAWYSDVVGAMSSPLMQGFCTHAFGPVSPPSTASKPDGN